MELISTPKGQRYIENEKDLLEVADECVGFEFAKIIDNYLYITKDMKHEILSMGDNYEEIYCSLINDLMDILDPLEDAIDILKDKADKGRLKSEYKTDILIKLLDIRNTLRQYV